MKKALERRPTLYHYVDGERRDGANPEMSGNCTELRGDCTELRGDCTELRGNCTELRGNCTGLVGNCSGLVGNLDGCELTDEERKNGVNIENLIK